MARICKKKRETRRRRIIKMTPEKETARDIILGIMEVFGISLSELKGGNDEDE